MNKSCMKERDSARLTKKGVHYFAVLAGSIALLPVCASAQLSQTTTATVDAANFGSYAITERGPNHRVWQRVATVTNDLGEVAYETNGGYTELATGMHHLVGDQWVESSDEIQITASGGVATNCQHQVSFTANINTIGAIDLTMPDSNHLRSQILGLSYLDPTTGQYVLIASLKDSIGQVVGANSNQVVYADAFNGGFKADVVYRNSRAGFEQNIVIREQLPSPAAFNLNPTNTRLQVLTEFLNPPTAQVTQAKMADGTTVDQVLDFGQMSIGQGHAFLMGSGSTDPANGLPVNKHWLLLNSRRVLVEDVPFRVVAPQLIGLPAPSTGSSTNQGADAGGILHRVFAQVQLPPAPKQAKRSNGTMKLATLPVSDKGFVLDYSAVVNGTNNFTFQADTTYYVSGLANLGGTTVIEGGAVIKYTNSSSATIVASSVTCATGPYRMAVFTSKDDNSVGETITNSTGNPTNTGATYLQLSSSSTDLRYLRMLYAGIGIMQHGTYSQSTAVPIWHSQFVKCQNALCNEAYYDGYFQQTLLNVLISQCTVGLTNLGTSYTNGSHLGLYGENLTVDQVQALLYTHGWTDSYPYAYTSLKNSILTGVQYQIQRPTGDWDYDDEGDIVNMPTNQDIPTDHCSVAANGSGIFQAIGAGNYYLADGSTNRNTGAATSLPATLGRDLKTKTTWPPLVYSNLTINTNLPLSTQVPRNVGTPDLGYHYDPIDYAFGHVTVTNAALTLVPGTVIGTFGIGYSDYGLSIGAGGQMISVGFPTNFCHIVTYNTLQEEPGTNVWQAPGNASVTDVAGGTGGTFAFRFTDWSMLASPSSACHINLNYDPVNFQDCQFHGAAINTWYPTMNLTNCLFERVNVSLSPGDANTTMVGNNLFYGGRLSLVPFGSYHAVVRDNLFDHTTIIDYSSFYSYTGGYNAYVTNWTNWNRMKPTMSSDLLLTNSPVYQKGPLGNYYEPTNSLLIDRGCTNANLVGLYHYTTQTSQVKETNSPVDIGYHYVALGANGLPVDTDGDGVPDYVADANGNGIFDTGDPTNWRSVMVVGWGDDVVGQCDVPFGLTNAMAVAGGGGQSMALINNGTVMAWGQNDHGQGSVPTNITGVTMIAAGWYHDLALLTNGTVTAWGLDGAGLGYHLTEVPSNLTSVAVISAQALHSLALASNGTVVAWGYGPDGEANVPSDLSNVVAIAAGYQFNLAVKTDGTVRAWGNNTLGQCNVPTNLSSVAAVAAGPYHSLALLSNKTVVSWGDDSDGETNVPAGLTNVVAIAAGGDPGTIDSAYSLALKSDGRLVVWGEGEVLGPVGGLTNVIAIGAGADHALAVRLGPLTPVITLEPANQYQIAGGNVTFNSRGAGLYSVTYQWQTNSVNLTGATNATLSLTNVQAAQQGVYNVLVSNEVSSILSSNANFYLVTQPVIVSQTPMPTNQVVIFDKNLTLSVAASAPGQSNGFPLSYQWKFNGTNIGGATSNSYTLFGDTNSPGIYSVVVSNAVGNASASWQVTMTYAGSYIDVGTLAYHLSTNAVGYASGYSGSDSDLFELSNWTYGTYSGTNLALLTNAVWSTSFWLHGVQGLSATCIGYSNGLGGQALITMVSPRHYLFARHTHPEGALAAFLDTNNVIYWRTTLERVDVDAGNDLSAGILNADLPPSVGYLTVVPTNLLNYLPTNNISVVQGIGMNQGVRVFSQPMTFGSPMTVSWNSSSIIPFGLGTNWSVAIRGGDSSNPERLLINNQLVLVSDNESVFGGPNYAFEFGAINQMMHYLSTNNSAGTDYQLTPFSLTNWSALH